MNKASETIPEMVAGSDDGVGDISVVARADEDDGAGGPCKEGARPRFQRCRSSPSPRHSINIHADL